MSCDKNMTFEECELAVLRSAVDKMTKKTGKSKINNPEIKEIIKIVEDFLKTSKRICYGGTAINNILPLSDQFYDKDVELPDYDFFSPQPLKDAKKLADIYHKKGFTEVEAKSGMHPGTFKVYVNFIPIADITYLVPELYKKLHKKSLLFANIYYCPPNYLRMSMYLELSRPNGDVSRWEKVLKRLTLLNKHYPLRGKNCRVEDIQRLFQYGTKNSLISKGGGKNLRVPDNYSEEEEDYLEDIEERIFYTVRDTLAGQGCVFFGAFANRMYLRNLRHLHNKSIPKVPDFDVLSDDPETCAKILKERLHDEGMKQVKVIKHSSVGEILPEHFEVKVNNETIAFVYKTVACHSYNVISIKKRKIRVATIDTMLSLYLAFIYINNPYYDVDRILCMSQFLFDVQQKNRLRQKGILRRFSINCYGEQKSIEDVRGEKSGKYKELKGRKCKEHEKWFLKYRPYENKGSKRSAKYRNTTKKKSRKENKSNQEKKTLKNRIRSLLPI